MKNSKSKRTANRPTLRFNPYSWSKLLYLRDRGNTEVGGFGICRSDDLLRIDDVQMVKQTCTQVTVEFNDESVADFFDRHVDAGLRVEQFARMWLHTHPGDSARPSSTDETTFARVFGASSWAVMFILAQEGECYARLQCNVGPGLRQELAVEVDYSQPFAAADWDAWDEEYLANVGPQEPIVSWWHGDTFGELSDETPQAWRDAWHNYSDDEFVEISAYERF